VPMVASLNLHLIILLCYEIWLYYGLSLIKDMFSRCFPLVMTGFTLATLEESAGKTKSCGFVISNQEDWGMMGPSDRKPVARV
jgi:hypothetical protein